MTRGLATIALLTLMGSAQAQFKATPNTSSFPESGMFECGVLQLSQRGGDSDPVSVINVNLVFKDGHELGDTKQLDTMYVSHSTAFGAVYPRSDQYTDVRLVQTRVSWRWSGTTFGKRTGRSP